MAFVRQSKFRHVFGKLEKKENCYEDIRITKSAWESTYCAVNPKFLAIVLDSAGGGAFLVLPLEKTGRIGNTYPVVGGHKLPVLDIAWNPFNDNMIASSSEDSTIKLWEIPDGGLEETLMESLCDLEHHQKKVGIIRWHPVAENILLSAGADHQVCVWNLDDGSVISVVELPDLPLSACWSWNGSKVVMTCKDKQIRVFDGRTLNVLKEKKGHEGAKPSYAVFLKDDKIFTTGFSKMSERQYSVLSEDLEELALQEIDASNGVIFPFYDPDNSLIYLCGKGDTVIRYFEITDKEPYAHYLDMFSSSDPQRGMGMMPKRGVNVNNNEMTKFYKLLSNGCHVIPMTVPRKSELFQSDIYPDTSSNEPCLTAEEWLEGKNSDPKMMSMQQFFKGAEKSTGGGLKKAGGLKGGLKKSNAAPVTKLAPAVSTPVAKPAPVVATPVAKPAPAVSKPVSTPAVSKPATPYNATPKYTPAAERPSGDSKANSVSSKPKEEESKSAAEPIITLPPGVSIESLYNDMKQMKETIKKHENRIEDLETKVQTLESMVEDGSEEGGKEPEVQDEEEELEQ